MLQKFLDSMNVKERCAVYRVGLWQCPHFLFIIMGFFVILSIITTHLVAQRYAEPEIEITILFIVTTILLVISHAVVSSFDRVAQTSQLKSEFISILSHELRNPLSAIKWQINILSDPQNTLSPEDQRKSFVVINEHNERMIRMVNDLLDVNRIEDNALSLSPSIFSLVNLTQKVSHAYEAYARASNIEIDVTYPKIDLKVKADEHRMESVISRFFDNAIRYSVSGGEVSVTIEDLGTSVRWSISDEGVGIPAEDAKRIFSKFFRATNILRYQTEGLGVGLYIAKYIIRSSGGEIGFRTMEGRGSAFFFTLPKA